MHTNATCICFRPRARSCLLPASWTPIGCFLKPAGCHAETEVRPQVQVEAARLVRDHCVSAAQACHGTPPEELIEGMPSRGAKMLAANAFGKQWTSDGFRTLFGKSMTNLYEREWIRPGLVAFHGLRHFREADASEKMSRIAEFSTADSCRNLANAVPRRSRRAKSSNFISP